VSDSTWSAVDDYLEGLLTPPDSGLDHALQAAADAGLPAIQVPALQGKLLHLLVHITSAKRVLEVGTLGGYSTIWLARALPEGGEVVTLEIDAEHARVATANFAAAGVGERVRLLLGPAMDSLPALAQESGDPFDLAFIDADKVNNPSYVDWAIKLGRPGTVVVVDNVVRGGAITNATSTDESVVGTRAVLELLATDPRLEASAIQTVGAKGYDGFALAVVR
jgi:predicted O-methyltransferase YrrM